METALRPIRVDDDYAFPMTDEMIAFMDAYNERRKKITTHQEPAVTRREYIVPSYDRTPLYTATRIHIAEIWLGLHK